MKILTINWTYRYGSTGKLICDIEKELPQHEFFHCYEYRTIEDAPNGEALTGWIMSHVYNRTNRIKGLPYANGYTPTKKLLRRIESYKPDIVHMHCPNGNTIQLYQVLQYLKENRYPTIITNHAEFFYTGNCAYAYDCEGYQTGCKECPNFKVATGAYFWNRTAYAWKKMKEAFRDFDTLHMVCVSEWQRERLTQATIGQGMQTSVIGNGIDTSLFQPGVNKTKEKYTLLQVTSSFSDNPGDIKGGRYLIELAKRMENQNVEIRVAGATHLSENLDLPKNLVLLGNLSNQQDLVQEYQNADLVVLTSKKETFGMACAESLCCGTPVVGFLCGGTESIALKEYTKFCEYANVDALEQLVVEYMNYKRSMTDAERNDLRELAKATYAKEKMAEQYNQVYCMMGKKENNGD